jgi:lysine 2,3-aminomutase
MSFRVIGLTDDGRRILRFQHDSGRTHSPIIHEMGEVFIIESKSIARYLRQMKKMGEKVKQYESIWGYSMSETEQRAALFDYPKQNDGITGRMTNLVLGVKPWKEYLPGRGN